MSAQEEKRTFQTEVFNNQVRVDPTYAEKTLKAMEYGIQEIYEHKGSIVRFEELYRNAYNLVLLNFGEELYSALVTTMSSCLKEISQSIDSAEGETFLEMLDAKWINHKEALQKIEDILMYMVRNFIPSTNKTSVQELGMNLWRDVVIHSNKTQARLPNTLLELVLRERSGESINRGLMRNIIKMLTDLGFSVYQVNFEKHFLDVSTDFYCTKSQEFINSCELGDYLKKVEKCLNEEMDRVSDYLDGRSKSKITTVVEKEMIKSHLRTLKEKFDSHMQTLVDMEGSGLVNMLVDDKYEDFKRMYDLSRRMPAGFTFVIEAMKSFIQGKGEQLVVDGERWRDPVDFVQGLLDFKDKCEKCWEKWVISIQIIPNEQYYISNIPRKGWWGHSGPT